MPKQLSLFDDRQVMVTRGLERLLVLDFNGALEEFSKYISLYPGSSDLKHEIEIADFFIKNMASINENLPLLKKVEGFYSLWEEFETYIQKTGYKNRAVIMDLRKSYFNGLAKKIENQDLEGCLFFKDETPIGLIYLFGDDLTTATKLLQEALLKNPSAVTYAYLGDSYFLRGEIDWSRICYREAFTIDPHQIDIDRLRDPDLPSLIERIKKETDFPLDWLPVYAQLEGLFSDKEFKSFDDLKIAIDEYDKLDREYTKDKDEKLKASLFYRAMVLSDNHRMLKFIKQFTIAQVREKMKRLNGHLFEMYMQKIGSET